MLQDCSVASNHETHYQLLRVSASASQEEIKSAYHRVLLSSHPDKKKLLDRCTEKGLGVESANTFDIARIQEAYRTLMNPEARAAYNESLVLSAYASSFAAAGPRPAQVVSLEEFTCIEADDPAQESWTYACRCGGSYAISETELEDDLHMIACERCSEVIYVGYEALGIGENES
ncbi:hypothetical protein M0805_008404 [Coniferiporia weirii]|nr:hypothetical protein M0805_008404 [Coniferiporia weirii]